MKKILFLPFILFLTLNSFAQFDPSKLAGVYQWCPYYCETIKLNADFTFDYLLAGDLYNNQRTNGIWKFVAENKIHLKSPESKLIFKVDEKQATDNDKILIQTIDNMGAIIPGVTIKIKHLGSEKQFVTGEDGTCEIPKTEFIEINWLQHSGNYKIKNLQTNYLIFEIESFYKPSVDDVFLYKNRKLYKVSEDETVSENAYEKLGKKISNKLFPNK